MDAAECALRCARVGESSAGCCSLFQGEFWDVKQVLAQKLLQSQLQQFILALPFPSLPISSALPPSFHPVSIPFFFPIIKAAQSKSQPLLLGQQLSIFCTAETP